MINRSIGLIALICFVQAAVSSAAVSSLNDQVSPGATPKKTRFSVTLEPFLGYQKFGGLTEKQINAPFTSSNGEYSGLSTGARSVVEYQRLVFTGFDLSYAPSLGYLSNEGKSPTDSSSWLLRTGVIVGINLNELFSSVPLRFWLGYNFLDILHDKNNAANTLSSSSSELTLNGYSFKAGLGYQGSRYFNINLEYIASFYTEIKSDLLSPGISKSYRLPSTDYFGIEGLTSQALVLSISTPINFHL